jgi:hypothetical protein
MDSLFESIHLEQKGSGRIILCIDLRENVSLKESSEDHDQEQTLVLAMLNLWVLLRES